MTTSTEVMPGTAVPVARHEGLSKTEIALMSSAAVIPLIIVILALAYCKFRVCRRKSRADKPSNHIKFSVLSRTSTEAAREESTQNV